MVTVRKLGGHLVQKELETPGLEPGQFQKAAGPGGGFDGAIQLITLKHMLDLTHGLDPAPGEPAAGDRQ